MPAVIIGIAMLMLLATGSTLNLQSYMGIIMSTGVSVANAILIVTNAESLRLEYRDPFKAAVMSASNTIASDPDDQSRNDCRYDSDGQWTW